MGVRITFSNCLYLSVSAVETIKMKAVLFVALFFFIAVSEFQADANPRIPIKKEARGFDYEPNFQKRADYDYDYYPYYYAQMYQKRGSVCLPFGMSCSVKGIPAVVTRWSADVTCSIQTASVKELLCLV